MIISTHSFLTRSIFNRTNVGCRHLVPQEKSIIRLPSNRTSRCDFACQSPVRLKWPSSDRSLALTRMSSTLKVKVTGSPRVYCERLRSVERSPAHFARRVVHCSRSSVSLERRQIDWFPVPLRRSIASPIPVNRGMLGNRIMTVSQFSTRDPCFFSPVAKVTVSLGIPACS